MGPQKKRRQVPWGPRQKLDKFRGAVKGFLRDGSVLAHATMFIRTLIQNGCVSSYSVLVAVSIDSNVTQLRTSIALLDVGEPAEGGSGIGLGLANIGGNAGSL